MKAFGTAERTEMEEHALNQYEAGGHWVYETFGSEDYKHYYNKARGKMALAKVMLDDYWKHMNEQQAECAWDGPE
jgi:hypothetical protein